MAPNEMNIDAKRAAFELSFANRRAPLGEDGWDEVVSRVAERAASASREEIADTVGRVKGLSESAYEVSDRFRDGKLGEGAEGRKRAVAELQARNPGFEQAEYEAAFASGLFWTAF